MVNKQDRQVVRTAADLERKYDLASIAGIKKAVKNNEVNINKTNKTLENFVNATLGYIDDLQNQIDGNITTWFYDGVPTLENLPANEWTTDEDKANHIGDLYYDRDTGYAYRFMLSDTYEWLKLSDSDVIEALALANAASDTADSKRRVFTDTPYPPYDNGDLWFKDGEIYICQISKGKEEKYAERDFIIATKYTDDTVAKQVGDELTIVKGTVTEIKEGVDQFKVSITETVEAMDEEIETAKAEINMNSQEIQLIINKGASDTSVIYTISETPTMDNYPADHFFEDIYYPREEDDPDVIYPGDLTWEFTNESYASHYNDFSYNETSGETYVFTKLDGEYAWKHIDDKSKFGYLLSSISSINADIDSVNIQVEQTKNNLADNYYTKTETEAKINVKSDAIQLSVDAEIERASGEEKKLAAALELKVDTENLVSQLNMSADEINIAGDRFTLDSTNTQIDTDGKITTKNIDVTGGNVNIDGSSNTIDTLVKKCKVTFSDDKFVEMSAYPYGGFIRCTDGDYRTFIDGTAIRLQSINSDGVYGTDSFISNGSAGTYIKVMEINANGDINSLKKITASGSIEAGDLLIGKGTGVSYVNGYLSVGGSGYNPDYKLWTAGSGYFEGNLGCGGTKNRIVDTHNYGKVLLNAYEMTTPMFGDIGTAQLDESGECIIFVDDVFLETIDKATKYEVFLQKYGKGDIWVDEINDNYFVVKGSASLRFAWEIKGKQLNYSQYRLESEESNNFDSEYMQSDCVSAHDFEGNTEESAEQYETVEFDCEGIYDNVQFEDTLIYEF